MSSESVKKGIVNALNSYTNPQSITTQIIGGVINSPYTKQTIRKFLLDPIQRKVTPSRKFKGYTDTYNALYSLYTMDSKQFLEVFNVTHIGQKILESEGYNNLKPTYKMSNALDDFDQPRSVIMNLHGSLFYIQYCLDDEKYKYYVFIYMIGGTKRVREEFDKVCEETRYNSDEGYRLQHKREVSICTFDGSRGPRRSRCTVPTTIIIDHVKDDLNTIIKSIKLSEDVSKNYSLNKTTGILLYGPHGTGKSTLVRYLAMELNRTILLSGADNLMEVINFVKNNHQSEEKFIILIEDIDFKFVDRRNSKKDDTNAVMMENTDLLFQILDGVLSENNLVVCATTNYIDRLDPALIRDGRFDYRIEVNGLDYKNACAVCEKFDIEPDEIKLSEWDVPISPATLQTFILKYKTTVAE